MVTESWLIKSRFNKFVLISLEFMPVHGILIDFVVQDLLWCTPYFLYPCLVMYLLPRVTANFSIINPQ